MDWVEILRSGFFRILLGILLGESENNSHFRLARGAKSSMR